MSCLTFKQPVLALRLLEFDLPPYIIGPIFSIDTVTFIIVSFAMNFIPDAKKNFLKILFVGIPLFAFAMLLLGPAPFIFPNKYYIIFMGILLAGASTALINNNAVPAMNQILMGKNLNVEKMKNNVSAINTSSFALGSIIGPMSASILTHWVGFRAGTFVFSCLLAGFTLLKFYSAFILQVKKGDIIVYTEINPEHLFEHDFYSP